MIFKPRDQLIKSDKITAPASECGAVIAGGIVKVPLRLVATACTESLGPGPVHIKVNRKEICLH